MIISMIKDFIITKRFKYSSNFEVNNSGVDFNVIEKHSSVKRSMFEFKHKVFGLPKHMKLTINKKFYWMIDSGDMVIFTIKEQKTRNSFVTVECRFKTKEKAEEAMSLTNSMEIN